MLNNRGQFPLFLSLCLGMILFSGSAFGQSFLGQGGLGIQRHPVTISQTWLDDIWWGKDTVEKAVFINRITPHLFARMIYNFYEHKEKLAFGVEFGLGFGAWQTRSGIDLDMNILFPGMLAMRFAGDATQKSNQRFGGAICAGGLFEFAKVSHEQTTVRNAWMLPVVAAEFNFKGFTLRAWNSFLTNESKRASKNVVRSRSVWESWGVQVLFPFH